MEPTPSVPAEADNPLRLDAQQRGPDTHVHLLALLRALLLVLFGRLLGRRAPAPHRDWFAGAHAASYGDATLEQFEQSRAYRRLRARIGWILRGTRNRGMRPSGAAPMRARPACCARAPPSTMRPHIPVASSAPRRSRALPGPMPRARYAFFSR